MNGRKTREKPQKRLANARLRYHRQMRQWTQADLASELYQLCDFGERERGIISVNMVSSWERGEHQPSPFWQKKLCRLFATTPDDLGLLGELSPGTPKAAGQILSEEISLHERLADYLRQQQHRLFDALASGSTYLRVGDIIGGHGLFVPPPWEGTLGPDLEDDLTGHLVEQLCQRQHVLLLGEAGQGKTTVLKQVFARLADRFMQEMDASWPLPIYISLREVFSLTGNALDLLWEQVSDEFPLDYEAFLALARARRLVFLFDGFDEIRGDITQQFVNERAASKIFLYPSLLSCRKSFFDVYLARSPLQELYARQAELLSFALTDPVKRYITTFCQQKQQREHLPRLSWAEDIIRLLESNQELRDLAQRPLLLLMILEIFTSARSVERGQWTVNKLYRIYVEQWLKTEAAKPDSVLRWSEKALLLQEVAWHTYHTRQHSTFPYEELVACIQAAHGRFSGKTDTQVTDDLCFRTLLCVSEGDNYTFLHKSFQEYFVARYVFECMHAREQQAASWERIEQTLSTSLPFDIALFLKQMLKECTPVEKELVTANLAAVYQRNRTEERRALTIRQQASHYLTSLNFQQAIQFLEHICAEEPDKWVQRGIMVGLALYCRRQDMLDRYVQLVRDDPEAAAINLGYHLVYYGDCAPLTDYHVEEIGTCEKTVAALFRHLEDEHYYQIGWSLDILTLTTLLRRQGVSILQESQQDFLKTFLQRDYSTLGDVFTQEKAQLKMTLEGALKWI
jgi:transcriptional regulator with XRE-family HTH domain